MLMDGEDILSGMIQFYGYKKCSTCRNAEKALEAAGKKYTFTDITEAPPSAAALKKIQAQSGLPLKKLFNTSGEQYKLLGIKDKLATLSDAEAFKLLAGNGRLIKRPLVTDGTKSTVGLDAAVFGKTWG
jgi:arsenate reductase